MQKKLIKLEASKRVSRYLSFSSLNTNKLAFHLALKIKERQIFALSGNLGAGKTVFVKGMGYALGVAQKKITSPTFKLLNSYPLKKRGFKGWTMHHFDLYRIKNSSDFTNQGFKTLLNEPKSVIVIEWPEKIKNLLPKHTAVSITIPTAKIIKKNALKHGNINFLNTSIRLITVSK